MNALEDMKVGRRIGLGFAVIMILLAVTTALSIWHLRTVAEATREMMQRPLAKERMVADWYRNIHSGIRRAMAIAKSTDESLAGFFEDDQAASTRSTEGLMSALEKLLDSDAERAQLQRTLEARKIYVSAREAIKTAKTGGKPEEAARILEQDFMSAAKLYQERVQGLLDLQRKSIDATSAEIDAVYQKSRNQLIVLGAFALLLGTAAAFVIARSILKQLGGEPSYAAGIAGKIAAGDLAVDVKTEAGDRSSLLFAMKSMRDSLADIVSRVRSGTDTIATASGQISAGNMDLSSRTEQQASSLEETAASMEELTGTVKQNADNARQANGLAASASEVAKEGGELVSKAMATMTSINASSRRIVDITGVIDGIAFQTNILALNAAVEAARAGEQGRGFAVVAGEVRALAKRSAAAAKEIKALIDESVENVDTGTLLVNQAGGKMKEIVASVARVTDIMAEIAAASREQSDGIEQVNRAVGQMDEVTQQNAALVEQAAAATESLQEQANKLVRVVGVFKLAAAQAETHEAAPMPDVPAEASSHPHVAANVAVLTPKKLSAPLPATLVTARERTRRIANAKDEGIGEWEEF